MKNSSVKNSIKAILAVALFSLGFARAAAHIDPSQHVSSSHSVESTPPGLPATYQPH